jgi:FG-GAP-like repeat
VILLLAALFSFQPFDTGLPRGGQWRHGLAVADMNGDARPDLAFSSPRKQPGPPVIFLNQGNGQWRRWQEARFPSSMPFDYGAVAAASFDGNGAADLALASHYRGVIVLLNDGHGTFTTSNDGLGFPTTSQGSAPFSSRAVVALDWNRDGLMDFAALSDGPRPGVPGVQLGVTVFENLGTAWKTTRAATDVVFGDDIATGDVDGDLLPDLVTASSNTGDARILRLGADALGRRAVQTLLAPAVVRAADLHDFDDDGRDEIVIAYTSAAQPRRGSIELMSYPNGVRSLWSEELVDVADVAAGDINGDGAADVVAALQNGQLLTFRGDGQGFVTRDADISTPEWRRGCNAYAVSLADLDGDGRDEIIAAFAGESAGCTSQGGVEVWRTVPMKRRRAARH